MNSIDHNVRSEIEDGLIAQYLLGELSAEEAGHLEEKLFAKGCFQQLLVVEEDLIEAYICGELNPRQRERFESHFLALPARWERVEFTRTLFEVVEGMMVDQAVLAVAGRGGSTRRWSATRDALRLESPAWRFSLAIAELIILIGVAWVVVENLRLSSQSERLRADLAEARQQQQQLTEQRERNEQLTVELRNARDQLANSQPATSQATESPSPILAFLFTLNNSSREGGERRRLIIPRGPRQLQLQFQFQFPATESYRGYLASLYTPEGDQIASGRAQQIALGRVTLTLNASLFSTNDYIITLKGLNAANEAEEIADYQFTVLKK